MLKILAGFTAGVLTTSSVFLLLGESATLRPDQPAASGPQAIGSSTQFEQTARAAAPAPAPADAPRTGGSPLQVAGSTVAGAMAVDRSGAPASKSEPAAAAITPTATAPAAVKTNTTPDNDRPAFAAPVLPDEYTSIVARDRNHPHSLSQLYDDFSAEVASPAGEVDQKLLADLLAPIARQEGFEITSALCRQTLCEVTAAAGSQVPGDAWPRVLRVFYGTSGAQMFGFTVSSQGYRNGRRYALVILQAPRHQ